MEISCFISPKVLKSIEKMHDEMAVFLCKMVLLKIIGCKGTEIFENSLRFSGNCDAVLVSLLIVEIFKATSNCRE